MADEQTEGRVAQIIKNQNDLLSEQVKLEETLRTKRNENLTRLGEEKAQVQQRLAFEKERLKNLAEVSKLTEEQRANRAASLELQREEIALDLGRTKEGSKERLRLREKLDSIEKSLELNKEILNLSDEELGLLLKQTQEKVKQEELNNEAIEANEQLIDQTKQLLGNVTGISDQWKSGSTFTSAMLKSMSANMAAGKSLGESFQAMAQGLKETFSMQNIGASMILGVVSATKDLITEQSQATAEFKRATGLSGDYVQSLVDVQVELKHLGIATRDVAEQTMALQAANTTLVFESKATQDSLATTASLLESANDAGKEFAATTGVLSTTLGMSSAKASQMALDIAGAAKAMSVPPKEMLADFAALGPQLAAWGPNTKKVFLETAAAAKALNMQTSEMLDIASQFDTFDDAADRVGQLNAALGGDYFDTVEMVMATESERIDLILDGIDATGKSFGDMGRFEKKRLAEAAGMTVDQLSKIANGNRDLYTELQGYQEDATMTYDELSDAAIKNMSITERVEALQKSLAVSMRPVVELLVDLLELITIGIGYLGNWGGILAVVAGAFLFWKGTIAATSYALGTLGATATTAAGTAAGAMSTVAMGASTAMTTISGGFTTLSTSIATGLGAIAPALASFGAAGLSAIPIVLAIAAGLVAVGYAFKMIYEGIGGVIDSLSNLISNVADGVEKMYKLKDFNFVSTALGIGGIAAAVGALSLALWSLDTDPLEDLAKMGTSIAGAAPGLTATKETLVAASSMTPENVESMKQVSEQIIRLTTETAAAGNNAQLQTIKEIIRETGGAASTGRPSTGNTEVTLQIDGRNFGKILIPQVMSEINKIVKSKMTEV